MYTLSLEEENVFSQKTVTIAERHTIVTLSTGGAGRVPRGRTETGDFLMTRIFDSRTTCPEAVHGCLPFDEDWRRHTSATAPGVRGGLWDEQAQNLPPQRGEDVKEAGDVAVEQDATQETVGQARESLKRSRIVDGVAGLTQQGHFVLYALLMLHEEGDTPIRARDVQINTKLSVVERQLTRSFRDGCVTISASSRCWGLRVVQSGTEVNRVVGTTSIS
ncbi:hypothetical protein SAMN04488556_3416 [Halostagnicola kamekurae]|uniref:Uncharacterized protein n=1 Tax=Halostagnicola kamekurae TaxID=619731 RepID=A0A1I6TTA4_9EURY|nr:hypothetical protein SAMN04488556_3416 [Halostagnicola kamekurae]